jgi:hypothetical protein
LWVCGSILLCTLSAQSGNPADEDGDYALIPCHEERGRDGDSLVGHEDFVQIDHRNGHYPVCPHYGGDVHGLRCLVTHVGRYVSRW